VDLLKEYWKKKKLKKKRKIKKKKKNALPQNKKKP